jgi:hypothetical protein
MMSKPSNSNGAEIDIGAAQAVRRGIGERLQRDHPIESTGYPARLQDLLDQLQTQELQGQRQYGQETASNSAQFGDKSGFDVN